MPCCNLHPRKHLGSEVRNCLTVAVEKARVYRSEGSVSSLSPFRSSQNLKKMPANDRIPSEAKHAECLICLSWELPCWSPHGPRTNSANTWYWNAVVWTTRHLVVRERIAKAAFRVICQNWPYRPKLFVLIVLRLCVTLERPRELVNVWGQGYTRIPTTSEFLGTRT